MSFIRCDYNILRWFLTPVCRVIRLLGHVQCLLKGVVAQTVAFCNLCWRHNLKHDGHRVVSLSATVCSVTCNSHSSLIDFLPWYGLLWSPPYCSDCFDSTINWNSSISCLNFPPRLLLHRSVVQCASVNHIVYLFLCWTYMKDVVKEVIMIVRVCACVHVNVCVFPTTVTLLTH